MFLILNNLEIIIKIKIFTYYNYIYLKFIIFSLERYYYISFINLLTFYINRIRNKKSRKEYNI